MAMTIACARHFSSAFISIILILRWIITSNDLPFDVSPLLPKPTGILTECTWNVRVSSAWNVAFSNSRDLFYPSKTQTDRYVLLIVCVVDRYALHVGGIEIAQRIIKELVHTISEILSGVLHRCACGGRTHHPHREFSTLRVETSVMAGDWRVTFSCSVK